MRQAVSLAQMGTCALMVWAAVGHAVPAQAVTLVLQEFDTGVGVLAQEFPDAASLSSYVIDDFRLTQTTQLQSLTVFGFEGGNPLNPQPVFGAIFATPDVTQTPLQSFNGTYTPAPDAQSNRKTNLTFDLSNSSPLTSGTYYISAWIRRNSNSGGNQPFFVGTSTTIGNGTIAYFQNPGAFFGYGSEAVPLTTLDITYNYGLAFQLDGTPVAVPLESDLAGVTALAGLGLLIHRRRQRYPKQDPS